MVRKLPALILLLILAVAGAACSSPPGPSAVTLVTKPAEAGEAGLAGPATGPTPRAITPRTITLRVSTGDSGDGLIAHQQIISAFEKANPDIKVVLDPAPGNDYYGYLAQQIEAGYPPDIMQIGDDAVPRFVMQGALTDLGPYMRGDMSGQGPLNPNIYLPGVFQPGAFQGKQYLLPKDFSPLAVYYNKKLFDAYGVPYPRSGWTWDDFLRTAHALTRDVDGDGRPEVWGVQLPGAWTSGLEYWVAAAGGQLISPDGKSFAGYLNSPQTLGAVRFYVGLYQREGVAPPPADISAFGGGNTEFADGKAAMLIMGHWPEAVLRKNPKISLGVVGMPAGVRRANVLFWSGFAIAADSQHKDAAWRFLRFATGEEAARIWAGWGLPTVKSAAEQLGLTNDPIEGVWIGELAYLVPRAYVFTPYWGSVADPALRQALEPLILYPGFDAPNALNSAAAQAQAALDIRR